MSTYPVTCPTCFEEFEVPLPPANETPAEVDYDCEICCRPLRIYFDEDDGDILATAYGLGDSGPFG
jgi:hypothetical protein